MPLSLLDIAGNSHSTNGSYDSMPKKPRKRPQQPEKWKRNVAKNKWAKDEEYISLSTGKTCSFSDNRGTLADVNSLFQSLY